MEPVLHILVCCQGHHHNGDISPDPDVMELVFVMSSSYPDVSVCVGSAKVTIIMVTSLKTWM